MTLVDRSMSRDRCDVLNISEIWFQRITSWWPWPEKVKVVSLVTQTVWRLILKLYTVGRVRAYQACNPVWDYQEYDIHVTRSRSLADHFLYSYNVDPILHVPALLFSFPYFFRQLFSIWLLCNVLPSQSFYIILSLYVRFDTKAVVFIQLVHSASFYLYFIQIFFFFIPALICCYVVISIVQTHIRL